MTATDWSQVATGWADNRQQVEQMKAPLSERMLAHLVLRPGQQVLELGSGPGEFARRLAELVSPGGSVLASDVAPGMVEVARDVLAECPSVEVAEIDAARTGLPDASFDAVVFRMGLMLVDKPVEAVQEARRVLREAGCFAAAVWASPALNPWLTTVGMSAMTAGLVHGGPPTGPGGVFSLSDAESLLQLGREGGFDSVEVEPVDLVVSFRDADHHFAHVSQMAGPLAGALARADEAQLEVVRSTHAALSAPFQGEEGLVFPAQALLLVAR